MRTVYFFTLLSSLFFSGSSDTQRVIDFGNIAYTEAELFKRIATFNTSNGAPLGHGTVSMHNGHLVVIGAPDSGRPGGGFSFYDITDPRTPLLVYNQYDAETWPIREPHGYGYTSGEDGNFVALQTIEGFMIWDWTDMTDPVLVSHVDVPDVGQSDYNNGNWWIHYQAPYVILSGSLNGIYIYDATDKTDPFLVNHIPISFYGGFRTGSIAVMGNLLVTTESESGGLATMDISNPEEPVLLDHINGRPSYAWHFNGNKIIGAGNNGRIHVYDVSEDGQITLINSSGFLGFKGGYVTTQDHYVFAGMSTNAAKVDISNPNNYVTLGFASSNIPERDEDFASVIGNLMFISNDHEQGSIIVPHQTARDTVPPVVNAVSPADSALNIHTKARIGLSMTDAIDLRSLHEGSLIVRPVGGEPLAGYFSHQLGIVSFTPAQPLQPFTTYEVVLPQHGLHDYAGNSAPAEFRSVFTTGSSVVDYSCHLHPSDPAVVDEPIGFQVDLFGNSEGILYEWDFGDGNTLISPDAAQTEHAFSSPGHYLVQVTLRRGDVSTRCSLVQTVHWPLAPGGPQRSSSIVQHSSGGIWNVNPDNRTVSVIEYRNGAFEKVAEIPVGRKPQGIAEGPGGEVWVTCQQDASIYIIDPSTYTVARQIALGYGVQPFGIVFNPQANSAYVSLYAKGTVLEIDAPQGSILNELQVGASPRALAINADGSRLYITRFISPSDGGKVVVVDTDAWAVTQTINLAMDPGPDASTGGRGMPNYLAGAAISPDGRSAWVAAKKDNIQRGQFLEGTDLDFQNTVRAMVASIDLGTNQENLAARLDLNNSDSPKSIAFSPLGDYAFVTLQGSNRIDVRDAYTGSAVASLENLPAAPQGIWLDPDGNRLFVHSFLGRSVSVFDVENIVWRGGTSARLLDVVPVVANELLSQEVLHGKRLFYTSADTRISEDSYISCASCHNDGEHDGRVYDFTQFGEGFRNTPSLLGRGGIAMGNVHWTANFDEIQDFEGQIRGLGNGTGLMRDEDFQSGSRSQPLGDPKAGISEDLDALAAYVASLAEFPQSPFRLADGSMTASALQGEQLFVNLKCNSCHGGRDYTNSASGLMHDVGTLKPSSGKRLGGLLLGLDAPTLKDLWQTAPYLHDGSAESLRDVFRGQNPEDKHGMTAALTETELGQLTDYLLQLEHGSEAMDDPIELRLASPAENDTVFIDSTIALSVATNLADIKKIEYYGGDELIAQSETAPFTALWTPEEETSLDIRAKVYYNVSMTATVSLPHHVVVTPTRAAVSALCDARFSAANAYPGITCYTDRDFTLGELPDELAGSLIIRPPNEDKTNASPEYLCFDINLRSHIYVAYDLRAVIPPSWLWDWDNTFVVLEVLEPAPRRYVLFHKVYEAGTVSLGGNQYEGGWGAQSNYLTFVGRAAACPYEGETCDDDDFCTDGDTFDSQCRCAGQLIDQNNNSVCDSLEIVSSTFDLAYQVNLYPNPASSSIRLKTTQAWTVEDIRLFSSSGQAIRPVPWRKISAYEYVVDVREVETGLYLLAIRTGDGWVSKTVVVTRDS